MWDIKLFFIDLCFYLTYYFNVFFFLISDLFDIYLQQNFTLNYSFLNAMFNQNISFFFGLKFILAISFLILIRGGAPRYRYDYLTKLGWLKFLGIILGVFLFSILTFFFF